MRVQEIEKHLTSYVSGNQSLEEFEDWFLPATWNLTPTNGEVGKLASEVQLRLSEFDRGDRQETDLKSVLAEILTRVASRKHATPTRAYKRAART